MWLTPQGTAPIRTILRPGTCMMLTVTVNSPSTYQLFLSYSTDPDYARAREVEAYLESLHLRPGIRALKLEKLEICRDGSDFRLPSAQDPSALTDPVRAVLDTYLDQSAYLGVLCSRRATTSPYVGYEVEHFLQRNLGHRILMLVTEGTDPATRPDEVIPRALIDAGIHRRPYYDLRGMRRASRRTALKVRDWEEELVRLADDLRASSTAMYPAWLRRRDQVRHRRRSAAAALGALAIAALGWWTWTRTESYQFSHLLTDTSIEALVNSGKLADYAVWLVRSGRLVDAQRAIADSPAGKEKDAATIAVWAALRQGSHWRESAGARWLGVQQDPLHPHTEGDDRGDFIAEQIASRAVSTKVEDVTARWLGEEPDHASALQYVAWKLAAMKRVPDALRVARGISEGPDAEDRRAEALIGIAVGLDPQLAVPLIDEAWRVTKDDVASLAQPTVAAAYLKFDNIDRAEAVMATEGQIPNHYGLLVNWYVDRGDWARARAAMAKETSPSDARHDLIRYLLEHGRDADALDVADDPHVEHSERLASRLGIAKDLYEAKRTAKATELLQHTWNSFDAREERSGFAWLWRMNIVQTMAQERQDDAAAFDRLNQLIADAARHPETTDATVAIPVLLTLDRPADALALFDRLHPTRDAEKTLSAIALSFARIGDGKMALEVAHRVNSSALCVSLVEPLATALQIQLAHEADACAGYRAGYSAVQRLVGAHHAAEAIAWIETITDLDQRLKLIAGASPDLAAEGQVDAVLRLIGELNPADQAMTLAATAARLKDPARRHDLAERAIGVSGVRLEVGSETWAVVVRSLVKADEPDLAFVAAKRLTEDRERTGALISVAGLFATHRRLRDARSAVLLLPENTARAYAVVAVLAGWNGEHTGG